MAGFDFLAYTVPPFPLEVTWLTKAHLQGKNVGVRLACLPVAVPATVSFAEQDGLWLVSDSLTAHLARDGGGLPVGLKPLLFTCLSPRFFGS